MKTTYLPSKNPFLSLTLATIIALTGPFFARAQNLVTNSNFTGGSSSGWSTDCSIEINPQSTYGGPSSSIYVTEIDVERCMNQQVCILPGLSYTFSFQATRRPQTGSPASPGLQVKVTGTTSNHDYVNNTQAYTNTTWNMVTRTFTINVPSNSTDTKLNIQFSPNNNTTTYGVILGDIELAPASTNSLSINGPATSVVSSPNSFSLTGAPAGASYAWSFSGSANHGSSTSAMPTAISWSSMGAKTVSVALSNSVCTMATYSQSITISAILPVQFVSFTGEIKDGDALLTWTTENEMNARYFVIERSANGSDFDSIGVMAALNNISVNTYNFTDKDPVTGNNYYRLRNVDLDGKASYSKLLVLANNQTVTNGQMKIFPNPAGAVLNIEIDGTAGSEVRIQVFSLSGILMMEKQQSLSAGNNQQSLGITSLKNGHYFLKVINAQGTVQYVRAFVKL
jgi:hypothetical protein